MSEPAGSKSENFFKYRNAHDLNVTELDLPSREANDRRDPSSRVTGKEVRQIAHLFKETVIDKLADTEDSDSAAFWLLK